ncbi:hypothetical protein ACFL2F_02460 [Myxococcota bacterium]
MSIFIAGEGPNELGGWAKEEVWRESPPAVGVIEALLRRINQDDWQIVDGIKWKDIRHYVANTSGDADTRNVKKAALIAMENGCGVLAFLRDQDGYPHREADIETGIAEAAEISDCPKIVGGVAIKRLESWIVALSGTHRSEQMGKQRVRERLADLGIPQKNTAAMVELVEDAEMEHIPNDAYSLRRWLGRAMEALSVDSE